ncbi:MAG TPA: succinylglutamate desuccinylase/aspartoacylase family protein [Stellaceae bacterium]
MSVAAAPATRVAFTPPDLTPYRAGNTGIPYVTSLIAPAPGPHVMIMALTHGNEICGAVTLDRLFRRGIRPVRGTLTLAFANIAAYERFETAQPHRSRFVDEDFNRLWDVATLEGPRRSVELTRARELRPIIDAVDLLLDIHSMTAPSPPLMLTGLCAKSMALAQRVGMPEILMRDAGHAGGTRLRDYGAFGDPDAPNTALLIECGEHWRIEAAETAFATSLRFLAATQTIDAPAPAPNQRQRVLEVTHAVTVAGPDFTFAPSFHGLSVVPKAGTPIARDGGRLVVTPYDDCVIIMPAASVERGQTAMRLGRFTD